MSPFLDEVDEYFARYTDSFIKACKGIQALIPPDWVRSGTFWFQHNDRFDENLPISLTWHDGMSGHDGVTDDPIEAVGTHEWYYRSSENWPSELIHEARDVEDALRLRIMGWIRECWVRSGGRSHPLRFYVHDYASNGDFCLERGRFISQTEIDADLQP